MEKITWVSNNPSYDIKSFNRNKWAASYSKENRQNESFILQPMYSFGNRPSM
jgi:hypothetical protein